MRKNYFEQLRKDWSNMGERQWRDFLRISGELSQKQRRQLVEDFSEKAILSDREVNRTWLNRFMGSLNVLAVDEKRLWWKTVEKTAFPAMMAMERGLDFAGQDAAFTRQTLRAMAGAHPEPVFKAWGMLDKAAKDEALGVVVLGLLRSPYDITQEWLSEFEAMSSSLSDHHRRQMAYVLFDYAKDAHGDGLHSEKILVEELLDTFVVPAAQVLTKMQAYVEDPWGLFPSRLAIEERFRIDQETAAAAAPSRSLRI